MATAEIYRKDRPQIVYGLLCTRETAISVEVLAGNTAAPSTLSAEVEKPKVASASAVQWRSRSPA